MFITAPRSVFLRAPGPHYPHPMLHALAPRLLQREDRGVHKMADVHVGEVFQEVLKTHPGEGYTCVCGN